MYCKYCGNKQKDGEIYCNKCGTPYTMIKEEERPSNKHENKLSHQKSSYLWKVIVSALAIIVSIVSIILLNHNEYNSNDLRIFDLKGPVSTCKTTMCLGFMSDVSLSFTKDGELYELIDYKINEAPTYYKFKRENGFITQLNEECLDMCDEINIIYDKNNIDSIQAFYWKTPYYIKNVSYNNNKVTNQKSYSFWEDGTSSIDEIYFSYEDFDKFGNWTKCIRKINNNETNIELGTKEYNSSTDTIKREITYYN